MTEQLFQQIEEKMMLVLTELETVRKELQQSRQENLQLKNDHSQYAKKLQSLLELLDTLEVADASSVQRHEEPAVALA